ncbi:MAG: protein-L-isoaspartate(D-aspartate) O-methyltransferase [Candidatus Bathyarchaeia archaeon]
MPADSFASQRNALANRLRSQGVLQAEEVMRAFCTVPREEFLAHNMRNMAYSDTPLPILDGQTISAPHMVVMMCELLELKEGHRVLEIGAGSGYHAAVVAEIVSPTGKPPSGHVYTLEIRRSLVEFAKKNITEAGYSGRVTILQRDGTLGLPEEAPFDRILVTAAAPKILETLEGQLTPEGIMVIPVGSPHSFQELMVTKKNRQGMIHSKSHCGVAFVPLVGQFGWSE